MHGDGEARHEIADGEARDLRYPDHSVPEQRNRRAEPQERQDDAGD
jgi:hypothetical protein